PTPPPRATMNSHDAYARPSTRMVSAVCTRLRRLLAFRAGEAGLDPLLGLHVGRRIDALGVEALDVLEHHHLLGRVVARLADRSVLDRLVAAAERHADLAGRRIPLGVAQRVGKLFRLGRLAAGAGPRLV